MSAYHTLSQVQDGKVSDLRVMGLGTSEVAAQTM